VSLNTVTTAAVLVPSSLLAVLQQGELAVRGPMLFREYWGRPQATAEAFDAAGYFLTGDTVSLEGQPPYYRVSSSSSSKCVACKVLQCRPRP
jgi:long-subunit acyl-CoA synthetase (AMP-forming)